MIDQSKHSADIVEIISAPPKWLLRWGITLFFCVIMLLFGLCAFITYPDIIVARLKIRSKPSHDAVSSKFFGEMYIPEQKINKIKIGQKVLIKLKSYPHKEYGMLTGKISSVEPSPLTDTTGQDVEIPELFFHIAISLK